MRISALLPPALPPPVPSRPGAPPRPNVASTTGLGGLGPRDLAALLEALGGVSEDADVLLATLVERVPYLPAVVRGLSNAEATRLCRLLGAEVRGRPQGAAFGAILDKKVDRPTLARYLLEVAEPPKPTFNFRRR